MMHIAAHRRQPACHQRGDMSGAVTYHRPALVLPRRYFMPVSAWRWHRHKSAERDLRGRQMSADARAPAMLELSVRRHIIHTSQIIPCAHAIVVYHQ